VWCYGARAGPRSRLARRGRSRRAAICVRREMGARGVTTSPGLRWQSLGDDVAAWLLLYGAVLEAAIATATLPPPRSTLPRRAGGGAPGGGHYGDVTGRGAAAAALRRLGSDTAATGAARAGRRLGCAGTCDVGLEGAANGRGRLRKVREVELVLLLLHRGRAMDFAVGLLPFQDGIAAAGAVGGRGSGGCSGFGVDASKPPREAAGGERAVGLGPLSIIVGFFFLHAGAGAWFPPFARTRAAPGGR